MRTLADACGLNVATLYHYFPSKTDLVRAVIEERGYFALLADDGAVAFDLDQPIEDRLVEFLAFLSAAALAEEAPGRLLLGEGLRQEATAAVHRHRAAGRHRRGHGPLAGRRASPTCPATRRSGAGSCATCSWPGWSRAWPAAPGTIEDDRSLGPGGGDRPARALMLDDPVRGAPRRGLLAGRRGPRRPAGRDRRSSPRTSSPSPATSSGRVSRRGPRPTSRRRRMAPAVQRLLDAGSTLVGRSHTSQMAYSLSGRDTPSGGPVNPAAPDHDTGRIVQRQRRRRRRRPGRPRPGHRHPRLHPGAGLVRRDLRLAPDAWPGAARRRPPAGPQPRHRRHARPGPGAAPTLGRGAGGHDLRRRGAAPGSCWPPRPSPSSTPRSGTRSWPRPRSSQPTDSVDLAPDGLTLTDLTLVVRDVQGPEFAAAHRAWIETHQPTFLPAVAERIAHALAVTPEAHAAAEPRAGRPPGAPRRRARARRRGGRAPGRPARRPER